MARRQTFQDEFKPERAFGPSKAEQKQALRLVLTILFAVLILVVGITLRYTVFADAFKPKPFTPPSGADASPPPAAPGKTT